MEQVCMQCGRTFSLSQQEIKKYEEAGLEIPVSCSVCRRKMRRRDTVKVEKPRISPLSLVFGKKGKKKQNPLSLVFRGRFLLPAFLALLLFGFISGQRMLGSRAGDLTGESTGQEVKIFAGFDELESCYEQYGRAMGYASSEEYLEGANEVIQDPDADVRKEGEDTVYYLEREDKTVVLSRDRYIRIYYGSFH